MRVVKTFDLHCLPVCNDFTRNNASFTRALYTTVLQIAICRLSRTPSSSIRELNYIFFVRIFLRLPSFTATSQYTIRLLFQTIKKSGQETIYICGYTLGINHSFERSISRSDSRRGIFVIYVPDPLSLSLSFADRRFMRERTMGRRELPI